MNRRFISLLSILFIFVSSCSNVQSSSSNKENIYQSFFNQAEQELSSRKDFSFLADNAEEYLSDEAITIIASDRNGVDLQEIISLEKIKNQERFEYTKKEWIYCFRFLSQPIETKYLYLTDSYSEMFDNFISTSKFIVSNDDTVSDFYIFSNSQEYNVLFDGHVAYINNGINYLSADTLPLYFIAFNASFYRELSLDKLGYYQTILDSDVSMYYKGKEIKNINFKNNHIAGYRDIDKDKVFSGTMFSHYHIKEEELIKITSIDNPNSISYLDLDGNLICNINSVVTTGFYQMHGIKMTDMIKVMSLPIDMKDVLSLFE